MISPLHTPHPTPLRSVLMVSSDLCQGLPSETFAFSFQHKFPLCILYVTCSRPYNRPRFNRPKNIWRAVQIMKLLTVEFSPATCYSCRHGNEFKVCKIVHHHIIQINRPTRCNSFSSLLLDVYLQLNIFRASSRPSSGAQQPQ